MSKWRYEITEKNCNTLSTFRPKYVVFSAESVFNHLSNYFTGDALIDRFIYWSQYTNEIPTRAVYDDKLDWCLKESTYGNGKVNVFTSIEEVFPARRLGRMFPRHETQILYKRSCL